MATDTQKILIVYDKLLDYIENKYRIKGVCNCLIDALNEISSSDEMRQLVRDINNKSSNVSKSLLAMLQAETSENLTSVYDLVQLL